MEVTSATTTILGVTKSDAEWIKIAADMRSTAFAMLSTLAQQRRAIKESGEIIDAITKKVLTPVRTIDQEGNDV